MRAWVRVLGIDPGIRITGFGILDTNGQESRHVDAGVIKTNKATDMAGRLKIIYTETAALVAQYQPAELAIERVFVARNPDSALKLGQARSAAICATFSADIAVYEYAAREVKLAIVGKGSAGKEQVQHMVRVLLNLDKGMSLDASDALGIALCHAHKRSAGRQLAEAMA
jgi:crossover junction endodeoxyribonuclease RuvC